MRNQPTVANSKSFSHSCGSVLDVLATPGYFAPRKATYLQILGSQIQQGGQNKSAPCGPGSLGSTMSTRRNGSVESSLGGSCTCPKRQIAEDSTLMRWAYLDIPWLPLAQVVQVMPAWLVSCSLYPKPGFYSKKYSKLVFPNPFTQPRGKGVLNGNKSTAIERLPSTNFKKSDFFQKSVPRKRFPISGHPNNYE